MGWFSGMIRRRLWQQNKDLKILVAGPQGTEKSSAAAELASQVDPSFYANSLQKRKMCREADDVMKLIENNELSRGEAIVMDDLGTSVSTKTWQSEINQATSGLMQTMRPYNVCLICTSAIHKIDPVIKQMFTYYLESWEGNLIEIDGESISRFRIFHLQTNFRTGDIYYHYPKRVVDGRVEYVCELGFQRPPLQWERKYKLWRKQFVKELSIKARNKRKINDAWMTRRPTSEIAEEILSDKKALRRYTKDWPGSPSGVKKRIDQDLIATDFKEGVDRAYQIKKYLEADLFGSR